MKYNHFFTFLVATLLLSSCGSAPQEQGGTKEGFVNVHFDTCTELETNVIEDQLIKIGELVEEPSLITPLEANNGQKVSGWYTESSYENKWNFEVDKVEKNMTLFAKWANIISIQYYLKGQNTPIWTVPNAVEGEPLELHDELCDGYEFYGYFSDPECKNPFDLNKPLTDNTTVYMYRGDTMYFNARSIKRRFSMFAAGGNGSTAGEISNVKKDASGEEYVDINFGYSTSADPCMRVKNPQIDISKSQKIKIKFKNLGAATSICFYWISKYADGSFASNTSFESEANSYKEVLNGYECFMGDSDPWIERTFDLSSKFANGISGWGNSVTLISLRIQFGYISKNPNDKSNVIRIQSIKGISDDTNVGFKDSNEIKSLLVNDSSEDIANAKAKQSQNRGVIFPLNEDIISDVSATHYLKEDGLLMYAKYGSDINRYTFDVASQHIDASAYSYVTIRLLNYSYISYATLGITTISQSTGRPLTTSSQIAMSTRMSDKDEYTVNLFGRNNMEGEISSISITFASNGIDNAILLESISLSEMQPFQVPGINFNDPNSGGFTSNANIDVTYKKEMNFTEFNNKVSEATLTNNISYDFDVTAYSYVSLHYYLFEAGIDSVTLTITDRNGESSSYEFNELVISDDINSVRVAISKTGLLASVSLKFRGVGKIYLSKICFEFEKENALDLSDASTFSMMLVDWASPLTYIEDKSASLFNEMNGYARYYFGYLHEANRRETGNICLAGKSKIHIVYQNMKPSCGLFLRAYAVDKRQVSEYTTAINESYPFIETVSFNLENNMDKMSWKVATINIPSSYQNENYYLSNIGFGIQNSADSTVYIRGFVVA